MKGIGDLIVEAERKSEYMLEMQKVVETIWREKYMGLGMEYETNKIAEQQNLWEISENTKIMSYHGALKALHGIRAMIGKGDKETIQCAIYQIEKDIVNLIENRFEIEVGETDWE